MKKITTKQITEIALLTAVLCVLAPVSVPIGAVPISLATFAIYLIGGITSPVSALIAVCVYIALGAVGVPVFAGFMGGVERLIAPAGGFLMGYIPCAVLISLILSKKRALYMYPIAMVCGTIVLYACGLLWFMVSMKQTFVQALSVTILPFLAFDAIKIIVASSVSIALNKAFQGNRKTGHREG